MVPQVVICKAVKTESDIIGAWEIFSFKFAIQSNKIMMLIHSFTFNVNEYVHFLICYLKFVSPFIDHGFMLIQLKVSFALGKRVDFCSFFVLDRHRQVNQFFNKSADNGFFVVPMQLHKIPELSRVLPILNYAKPFTRV